MAAWKLEHIKVLQQYMHVQGNRMLRGMDFAQSPGRSSADSTAFAVPGYGNFSSITDFVQYVTSSTTNLVALPMALAKLAIIPGGIAYSLGAEGFTYLQVSRHVYGMYPVMLVQRKPTRVASYVSRSL